MRLLVVSTVVLAGLAALIYGVGVMIGGPVTGANAAAGVGLTAIFLLAGLAGLRLILSAHETVLLPGVLGLLGLQLMGLLGLWSERENGTFSSLIVQPQAFAAGALVAAVAWQVALVAVLMRTRQLIYTVVTARAGEQS